MGKEDQIQKQLEIQEQIHVEPQHAEAGPQQIEEAPQQVMAEPLQNFAQPVNVEGAAPPPEMAEPIQQQQQQVEEKAITRKYRQYKERKAEKKAAEAQRKAEAAQQKALREREKKLAEAKLKVDALVQRMKENPIPGEQITDYHGMRPTEAFEHKGEYLQRVILTQIADRTLSRQLLDEVRTFTQHAAIFDHEAHEFRFRNQGVPAYITNVLHQEVPEEIDELLIRESMVFSDANYDIKLKDDYVALEARVFSYLTDEQKARVTQVSMRRGEEAQAHAQAIRQIMEEEHMTRAQARTRYAELEQRPATLKHLERQRKAHLEQKGPDGFEAVEMNSFKNLYYANEEIRKAHPGTPALDWKTADELVSDYVREATRDMHYQMRVPNCEILSRILDSGRFKTQMETQSSRAALNLKMRKEFTRKCFGVDPDTLPPEQFEIYGYASHGDLVKESKPDISRVGRGVGQYGQVIVTLKKERMKGRTTMTVGDSLDAHRNARTNWADQPDLHAVAGAGRCGLIIGAYERSLRKKQNADDRVGMEELLRDAEVSYTELQYHGGVSVEDIESVTLLADYNYQPPEGIVMAPMTVDREMPAELAARLKELGIQVKMIKDGAEHEV